ncbi:MAG: NUDIX hydrolase [Abitibacteriaceae bacterium]|nr:NUDIX hydrolase [Abditibacteriaceae bacterium]
MLQDYHAYDASEQAQVQEMQHFIKAHTDCFQRSLLIGHLTGSAWIVNKDKTRVLLTHHRKLNRWLQLGGHADGDPDLLRVALREAQEESGLEDIVPLQATIFDVDIHPIPARGDEPEHLHYDVRFLFQANDTQPLQANRESKALAWVELNQVIQLNADESMRRMVAKTLSQTSNHCL